MVSELRTPVTHVLSAKLLYLQLLQFLSDIATAMSDSLLYLHQNSERLCLACVFMCREIGAGLDVIVHSVEK